MRFVKKVFAISLLWKVRGIPHSTPLSYPPATIVQSLTTKPDHESNHREHKRDRPADDSGHVEPIGMGLPIRLHGGLAQQRGISRVTPEPDRKNISHKRNCPDRAVDQEIETHAGQHDSRNLEARRDAKDDRPDEIGQGITDPWD